jgi:site-specific DNA-methyltransferase (adenine-specific)
LPAEYTATRDIPLADLTRFSGNARRGNVDEIRASIRRHGQYRSLVVRDTGDGLVILAGNHTRDAIEAEGHTHARCEVIQCSDDEARRINIADNRLSDMASDDADALVELLSYLDGDYVGTGWTEEDVDAIVHGPEELPPALAPDSVPEPPPIPVTEPGDIWVLGPHRIICGDCRDHGAVEKLLAGRPVTVAFTSPPYASQRAYDESSGFKPIPPGEYVDWFEDVQANVRAHLAEDGSWFVNIKEHCDDGQRHLYVKDLTIAHVRRWGWRFVDELCWTRNSVPGGWNNRFKNAWEPVFHFCAEAGIKFRPDAVAVETDAAFTYSPDNPKSKTGFFSRRGRPDIAQPGMARPSNVLKIGAETRQTENHSAPFPVALPAWFIKAYTDPGDIVFDPFMGSGSTLIAAHGENRAAFGCEISPAYCDVIAKRFEEATGVKPERVLPDGTTEPVSFT